MALIAAAGAGAGAIARADNAASGTLPSYTGQAPTHPVTWPLLVHFMGGTACHTEGGVCVASPQIAR
jgi:hypothetical protein